MVQQFSANTGPQVHVRPSPGTSLNKKMDVGLRRKVIGIWDLESVLSIFADMLISDKALARKALEIIFMSSERSWPYTKS